MNAYKRIHFIGVGGIGTSALAKLMKARGVYVSGSDHTDSATLQELRDLSVQVWTGSHPEKMGTDIELVVYSSAVPLMDEERVRGRHLDVPEMTYNEFLGVVSAGAKTIAVTGTHGKSTTTAMLGHILIRAGLNPTVVVGSKVPGFSHGNLQIGSEELFVVEACEHMAHMLHLHPWMIALTNIEFDHPDFYRDERHVYDTMKTFVERLPKDGVLVINTDDRLAGELAREICVDEEHVKVVEVSAAQNALAEVTLQVPGEYNRDNARVAWAAASALGVSEPDIRAALESFTGLWRRFEYVGAWHEAEVYTDYAHHPTALTRLLQGAREAKPNRRIVLCFQPHQHARTAGLFDEFVASMDEADVVVIPEIYGVAGRTEEGESVVSSRQLVESIRHRDQQRGVTRSVEFLERVEDAPHRLAELVQKNDVLLMVGAGAIDDVARSMISR